MTSDSQSIVVTGGAGFIGTHLVEDLLDRGKTVRVVDDFSNNASETVPEGATLIEGDIGSGAVLRDAITPEVDMVFHLAAHKSVDTDTPRNDCIRNIDTTYALLERMDDVGVTNIAFTSSSTVYGEADTPTPESYTPLEPISAYGASKLACESVLSTYAHSHDFTVWNFRFANIVGPLLRGAVIPDFITKLRENPETLTILGDGRQEKSYMHVTDCVNAMLHLVTTTDEPMNTFNLGSNGATSVTVIADIVSDVLDLDPEYEYTGGDRGWSGDVPRMRLSIENLQNAGFEPKHTSDEAVRRATRELVEEMRRDSTRSSVGRRHAEEVTGKAGSLWNL